MLLVSDRPLYIQEDFKPAGIPFDIDPKYGASLIERGAARYAAPPQILYENNSRQQNALELREQGITCLCVTRNRRDWLPQAIESYQAQSYTPRELLIIADGEDIRDLVPQREDIRLIQIEEGRMIGDKRNYGVSLARGKYVAHWDDDDYSAPDRLLDQMWRLKSSGMPVTGYSQIDFHDGTQWWRYTGDDKFAPGSSLLYEKTWGVANKFPFLQVNEDGEFVKNARERGRITTSPSNGMLTATNHPRNTSPRIINEFWTRLESSSSGLSVIIPSRTLSNVVPCVEAVREHEPEARIIVVDDGIGNNFASCSDQSLVVNGSKPFVFARNMNIGILTAGRDDVVLLNDDALLKTPGGFRVLQNAVHENPEFGIVGATTNAVGNRNQTPMNIGLRTDPRMVCFVAVFIPRTTLDKIGYLDERFYGCYGFEDDDYCYRVRRAGLKIGIHDGCFVDHASLKSTFRHDPSRQVNLVDGKKIFESKWGSYPL